MEEFYIKIQMLLMKKVQECGELKFLISRATDENIKNIDNICISVREIFQKYDRLPEGTVLETNPNCTQAFNYLMLNTGFKCQGYLAEDIVHGHLVDMCPPLSPYLFIQLIWDLKYEGILTKSILYIPVDLCNEILEITQTCIGNLDFERATNVIFDLMLNVYKKLITFKEIGTQSLNLMENMTNLVANFQELTMLLLDPKIIRLSEVSNLKKYERYGILLKRIITVTKQCLEYTTSSVILLDSEKLYKLTFGREPYLKCEETPIVNMIDTMNQGLIKLLLKRIKEIDYHIYLGWAELYDKEFPQISLQRSIGNECYYFMEFIKNVNITENDHLMECLQQLSSKPDPKASGSILTLEELCVNIENGKTECLKELLCRYREWDRPILKFMNKNKALLDKDDCLNLLEYLNLVFTKSDQEFQQYAYVTITKILSLHSIPDIYEIVVEYIIRHDARSTLESEKMEEIFDEFISLNTNLRSPSNLKIILLFLLRSPTKVLVTLLKITIGYPKYANIIISARDMLLLSPFLSIKTNNDRTFLIDCLKTVCTDDVEWNTKKLMDFVQVMLDNNIIELDKLINNVFIPYLEGNTFNVSNMRCICNIIHKVQFQYCKTRKTNIKGLLISLAKRMSFLRKQSDLSKYVFCEVLIDIKRILDCFLYDLNMHMIGETTKKVVTEKIGMVLEPIDKQYFALLWNFPKKCDDVLQITQDYERRCFSILNRMKEDPKSSENLRSFLNNFCLLRTDFLRHLILRASTAEYQKFGSELTILYWFSFGWRNEIDAYDNFVRLTIEACCIALEHPSIVAGDTFVFLLHSMILFSKTFIRLKGIDNFEEIYDLLVRNIKMLDESIKHSMYSSLYSFFLVRMNNAVRQDIVENLQELVNELANFCQQCIDMERPQISSNENFPLTAKIKILRTTYDFISACMKVPIAEAYECIARMDELFFSD